ncbi:uncharacterized protein LOC121387949 [Gigantopelta aegis]|uniref:uncharacterized protein LOC121387949 n=1 Tax=Gigantopelta aegis TaxID=1735272 RepID=UPI001B88CF42|nr:uncharacterized protein LOC121387949 [Gigantopelta aegis]
MKAVFVLGIMLACTSLTSCHDSCRRHGVNGCSTPFSMPFFYKRRFTHACNRHDVCYRCGHVFGISRDDCDSAFLDAMKQSCRSLRKRRATDDMGGHNIEKRGLHRSMCDLFALGYHTVVKTFAESDYRAPSMPFCGQLEWVIPCLPQRHV